MPMSPRLLRPIARGATGGLPLTIADLAVWLDASVASSVTLNGSGVSEWRDLSGNGRHATQDTAASQPEYGTTTLNGLAVCSSSSSARMDIAAFPCTNDATVFVVGAATGSSTYFCRGNTTSTHELFGLNAVTIARRINNTNASLSVTQGVPHVLTAVFGANLTRFFRGNTQATDNTAAQAAINDSRALTLFCFPTDIYVLNGYIAEFIYYQRQLTSTEQDAVKAYLSTKWDVSL